MPIKSVIRHLPIYNSSQDIIVALQDLNYELVGAKQVTATQSSHSCS
jgi:hypothetical protein